MKKIFIICLLAAFTGNAFSQVDTAVPNASIKTDYLRKSKNQKTTAWILLGTGTALMITGAIVSGNAAGNDPLGTLYGTNENANNGVLMFVIGGAAGLTSIPFFIASAKNKGRAMSVTIHNDPVPQLQKSTLARVPVPTVSLVLRF